MRFPRRLAALVCGALLAACAGPSTPPPPEPPAATAVSPEVAAAGETIVVTGTEFGEEGTLTVGGVEATVITWSDDEIEAVVPDAAPGGWQEVVVTTEGGESAVQGLFVGVAFSGEATALQDFILDQEPGTSVLLAAGTLDLGADELFVDNVDLYGRGQDETALLAESLWVLADAGVDVTVADLSFEGRDLGYTLGSFRGTGLPTPPPIKAPADARSALRSALSVQAPGAAELQPNPVIAFERFAYASTTAVATVGAVEAVGMNLDVSVRDSQLVGPETGAFFYAGGRITVERSTLEFDAIHLVAVGNVLEVRDSELSAGHEMLLGADGGLDLQDTQASVADGDLTVTGAVTSFLGSVAQLFGGPVSVTGSSLAAMDADITDGNEVGVLYITTLVAPITISDNLLLRGDSQLQVNSFDIFGANDITFTGNQDVRVGHIEGGDAQPGVLLFLPDGPGFLIDLVIADNVFDVLGTLYVTDLGGPSDVSFVDNELTMGDALYAGQLVFEFFGEGTKEVARNDGVFWHAGLVLDVDDEANVTVSDNAIAYREMVGAGVGVYASGDVTLTGNTFTDVDESPGTVGLFVAYGPDPLELTATGNTFTAWTNALDFQGGLTEVQLTAELHDNVFDMEFAAAPQVASLSHVGDVIDATDNVWGDVTDVAVLESYVAVDATTTSWGGGIDIDPIKTQTP